MPTPDSVVQASALKRITRSRTTRFTAATVVAGLAVGAIVTTGGGTAGAATTRAQSVGRFLDGAGGGMALEALVNLQDARAKAAPNASKRNPLDATLFDQADIPIGNGLKLPGGGVFQVGAANQIAVAKTNEYSYGAAGAVDNTGGAQLTDKSGTFPSDGTINISGAALGNMSIPGLGSLPTTIPGLPTGASSPISAATLGGIVGKIGAVQALAQTKIGGKVITPQSSVGDLQLAIGSPALGALIKQLQMAFQTNLGTSGGPLSTVLNTIIGSLPTGTVPTLPGLGTITGGGSGSGGTTGAATLPTQCSLTSPTAKPVSLENGGVVIDPTTGTITIDLKILLKQLLGVDISHLNTSNFDLVSFLVQNLPKILSKGLEAVVTGITTELTSQFTACSSALSTALGLPQPPAALTSALSGLQTQLTNGINMLADPLISASSSPLAQLASGLTGAVDIGLNVQSGPKVQPRSTDYKYTSQLAATPDQATNVVKGQSLVRAIEIDLLDASGGAASGGLPSGLPSLPGTSAVRSRQIAGKHAAAAASGDSVVSLALANAAAGPSTSDSGTAPIATPAKHQTTKTGTKKATLPTAVPAGAAGHDDGGSPLVPAALLLLGLVVAGGGVLTLRTRGKFSR